MIVTLEIQIKNKDGIRVKAGDIISVKPSNFKGTLIEIPYFYLKIDFGTRITLLSDARKLTIPQLSDGSLWWPSSDVEPQPTITAKRRYSISLARLQTVATSTGFTIDWNNFPQYVVNYTNLRNYVLAFGNNMIYDKYLGRTLTNTDLTMIVNAGK